MYVAHLRVWLVAYICTRYKSVLAQQKVSPSHGNIMQFSVTIFQTWKIMENDKSSGFPLTWKVRELIRSGKVGILLVVREFW